VGSLFGVYLGVYGTKVVKEVVIRLVTAVIIILCVISRMVAIPVYLQKLGYINMNPSYNGLLNTVSKGLLYVSGIVGALLIISYVIKAFLRRRKIVDSLALGGGNLKTAP
jgi:hypothetical protein